LYLGIQSKFRHFLHKNAPKIQGFAFKIFNKSLALAEMATVATIDIGRKEGAAVPLYVGSWVPSSTMWPGRRSTSVQSGVFIHHHCLLFSTPCFVTSHLS